MHSTHPRAMLAAMPCGTLVGPSTCLPRIGWRMRHAYARSFAHPRIVEGTLNEVVVALTGGDAAAPQPHLVLGMTEKILVPTEVTLRNVDLGLTAAARQVFELITNGTTIDILLSVEAVGANPCL